MPCGTMQAAGSSYSYIRRALCKEEEKMAKEKGQICVRGIESLVRNHRPAPELVFLPYLLGEKPQMEPRHIRKLSWNQDGA